MRRFNLGIYLQTCLLAYIVHEHAYSVRQSYTRAGYMYDSPDPAHLRLVPHRPPPPDHDLASRLRLQLFRRHSPGTQNSSDEIKLKEGGINNEGGMDYLLFVSHAALSSHHYFTSSLLFQLLSGQPPRAKNTTNKVKLKKINCKYSANEVKNCLYRC